MGLLDIKLTPAEELEQPEATPNPLEPNDDLDRPIPEEPKENNAGGLSPYEGDELNQEATAMRNNAEYRGVSTGGGETETQQGWGADYTTMSLGKKFKRSLLAGVGQVANETGDVIQLAGGLLPGLEITQDNLLSSWMHKVGHDIEDNNQVFNSKDMDEWGWSDMGNIEFWATDIAKQIPNLAAFLIPGFGGANIGKTALSKGVSYGMRKGLIKGTKKFVAKKGAAKGTKIGGSGLAAKLSGDTAEKMSGMVGAGVATNIVNSAVIAGDAMNRATDMGLTKEQAEYVAAQTFLDNSKYVLADMVSWGISFGKLNPMLLKAGNKMGVNRALLFAERIGRAGFRKTSLAMKGGIKGAKVLGTASLEGMEEQFQEVYEEWISQKNIAEAQGKSFDDYWTYFNSPEMKKTRGIAMGAGMFGASVPTMINEIAETMRISTNQDELLKRRIEWGKDAAKQESLINDVMANIVFDEQGEEFVSFLSDLEKKGVINEEEKAQYIERGDKFAEMYEKSQMKSMDGSGNVNMDGAHYLFNMMVMEETANTELNETVEKGKASLAMKLDGITDEATIKKITEKHTKELEEATSIIESKRDAAKRAQEILVAGEKMEGIPDGFKIIGNKLVIDDESDVWEGTEIKRRIENDEEIAPVEIANELLKRQSGLSEEQYQKYTKQGAELSVENAENKVKSAATKGKGFFDSAIDKAKGFFGKGKQKSTDGGTIVAFEEAKSVKDIVGQEWTDSNGDQYYNEEGTWKVKNKDGKVTEMTGQEAVEAYNRISGEQAQREAGKAEGDTEVTGEATKAESTKDVPNKFVVGGKIYSKNEDGTYQTGENTSVSAGKAMEDFNKAVDEKTLEDYSVDNGDVNQSNILDTFRKEFNAYRANLEGQEAGFIRQRLRGMWNALKKQGKLAGESFPDTEAEINAIIDRAVEQYEKLPFNSNKRYRREQERLKQKLAEGDAEIEFEAEIYGSSFDLAAFGGIEKLNAMAANRMPAYYGDNHTFIQMNGIQINRSLQKKFGKGVNVVLLDNINQRAGYDAVAMALGGTVFITPDAYAQPMQLFHEVLHVHYALNPEEPAIKNYLKKVLNNKKFVEAIKGRYADQVMYKRKPVSLSVRIGDINHNVYQKGDVFMTENGREINKSHPAHAILVEKFKAQKTTPFAEGLTQEEFLNNNAWEVEELPLEEQEIIKEELYTHGMQATIDNNYDIYFEAKDKAAMRAKAKGMWGKFRRRVDKKYAAAMLQEEELNDEVKTQVMDSFMKMDTESNAYQNNGIRFAREFSTAQKAEIKSSILDGKSQFRDYTNDETLGDILRENPDVLDEQIENGEAGGEQVSDDENVTINVNVQNQYAQGKTTSRLIKSFLRGWNKDQDATSDDFNMISDRDIIVPFRQDAKKYTEEEFVLAQRTTNYDPIGWFVADLDAKFKKKADGTERTDEDAKALTNAALAAMHKNFSSAVQEQPYQMFVEEGKDGTVRVTHEPLVSKYEAGLQKSLMEQYKSMVYSLKRARNDEPGIGALRADLNANKASLKAFAQNPNPTKEQTIALLQSLFRTKDLIFDGIVNDSIFYNGQTMPFMQAFKAFAEKSIGSNERGDFIVHKEAQEFLRGVITTNRKHTLNDMVMNPENNPTSTYNKQNYTRLKQNRLNKVYEEMRSLNPDFRFKDSKRPGRSKVKNFWLTKGGMQIESFAGIRNKAYGQNQKYSAMNENSFALASILRFVSDGNNESYMQTLGTASDSQSHYTVRMPKHSYKGEDAVALAEEVNRVLGEEVFVIKDGKITTEGLFGQDLKRTYEYWNANSEELSKIPELRMTNRQSNNNKMLGDAIFSNIVNKVLVQEEMFGAEAMKNGKFTKRMKNANSPVVPLSPSTRLDILPIKVPGMKIKGKKGEVNIADGDTFITMQAAEKLKQEYGVSMNIGDAGAFKIMSFNDNPEGNGLVQVKTMAFVLTDDMVKDNPMLQAVKKSLEARELANSDNPNYFGIAPTVDAMKQGDLPPVDLEEAYRNSSNAGQTDAEIAEEMSSIISAHSAAVNDKDGSFNGFDGSNFGIMQEMDLGATRSTVPTQLMANLLTNLDIEDKTGLWDQAIAIQKKAAQIMSTKMNQEVMSQLKTSGIVKMADLEKISSYLSKRREGNENVTDYTKSLSDIKSLNIPYLNTDAYNEIANIISRAGNKIQTAGGYAFQASEMGFVKPGIDQDGGFVYDNTLSDGSNGEPADAIIPKHIADEHGLKPGDTFIASRIPHHGPQTTQVFKVKKEGGILEKRNGSTIIVNSKFTDIIGADHDGDALYINVKPTDKMYAQAGKHGGRAMLELQTDMFNMISKLLMDPAMQEDREAKMEPKKRGVDTVYTEKEQKAEREAYYNDHHPMTIWGEAKRFNENVPFKNMVGIAAQVHRIGHLLRGYQVDLTKTVRAGGKAANGFKNNGKKGYESTAYQSAVLLNIILDNANDQSGSILGISPETVNQYAIMVNMGFSFKEVSQFMKGAGVKAWTEVNGNRSNVLMQQKSKSDLIAKAYRLISSQKGMSPQDIEQAKAEIDQMAYLDEVSNELLRIGTVISGHKKLHGDYHVLRKQIKDFRSTMRDGQALKGASKLLQSPEVTRYLQTAENMLQIHRNTNLAATNEVNRAYENMSNTSGDSFLMGEKGRRIKKNLWTVLSTEMSSHKSREYYNELPTTIEKYIENAAKTEGKLNGNPFLRLIQPRYVSDPKTNKAKLVGIELAKGLKNPTQVSENEIRYMKWHFARLPQDVQEALFHYDMLYNGFQGNSSFVPFLSSKYRTMLEKSANRMTLEHTRGDKLSGVEGKIATINSAEHPSVVLSSGESPLIDKTNRLMVIAPNAKLLDDSRIEGAILNNEPHYITLKSKRNIGGKKVVEDLVYRYQPIDSDVFTELNKQASGNRGVNKKALKGLLSSPSTRGEYVIVGKRNVADQNNTWLINNSEPVTPGQKKNSSSVRFLKSDSTNPKFLEQLSYEDFVHENSIADNEISKGVYNDYLKNFAKNKNLANTKFSPKNIRTLSNKVLDDTYREMARLPLEEAAPILNEVNMEIARRHNVSFVNSNEIENWDKSHDISGLFKWLGSSNVSQKKADLQALEKRLTVEYVKLEREIDSEFEQINDITDKLIKSKIEGPTWLKWIKAKIMRYFGTRNMYEHVYGNLIKIDIGVDPETKRSYKDMKLISRDELNQKIANKTISQEEVDFYNMFQGYTKKYAEIIKKERGELAVRDGYIPHLNSHALEAYSNRGLLNAFMMSKMGKTDPNTRQVVITAKDPLSSSGDMKTAEFGYFEDAYKRVDSKLGVKNAAAYAKLKARAGRLHSKGQNQDGTPLELSYVTRDTLLNGNWMDRFGSGRSVRAEDLPTWDLNHALTSYVKASAWKYGTVKNKTEKSFQGFDRLTAHVDGVIRLNQKYGNANTVELVQKVLRDKVIMGKNQTSFLGKKGDMAVDALNWLTTVVALGFKASIAVGNIAFGKYSNLRAEGGKSWLTGEQRFWGIGGDGNFVTGVKKAQAILKRYQLVDKNNMYDIGWTNKRNLGGVATDLALIAMTISENWIQGANFLGLFTEEEWNSYDKNGKLKPGMKGLSEERVAKLEYEVRKVHGRGYSALDQRMIGLYSLGRSGQMFKKWLVTNYNERFGEEIQNMYGEKEIGSMRQFGNMILAGFRGEIEMSKIRAYYDSLPEHQKIAFERAVRGMGMVIALSAMGMMLGDSDEEKELKRQMRKVASDANLFYNPSKVTKLSKVYPYYTVKSLANSGSKILGQDGPEHVVR